jgi:site-specific DNA-methyltransferase (adenine-specific)
MGQSRAVVLSWEGKERGLEAGPSADEGPRSVWNAADGSGTLLQGENLACLRALEREGGARGPTVTLAYLDPPFFTNREHAAYLRKAGARPGAPRTKVPAFDDRWPDLASWLEALGARLRVVRALLALHGSVVVHVDPKTSHYVRVLGDEIFGQENFTSEIVWRYRRWPSKTPNFQRVHDVLLRWRRSIDSPPRWNQTYEPLAASTLATWGTAKQRAVFAKDGRRARSSSTAEASAGVPMGDVWDIGVLAPISRERTGYPSQKPEALLARLVAALSCPGDRVLDPYAGSGTTLAAAKALGRPFVGIDSSDVAIRTILNRLGPFELMEGNGEGRSRVFAGHGRSTETVYPTSAPLSAADGR